MRSRIFTTALAVALAAPGLADIIRVPDSEAGITTISQALLLAEPGDVVEISPGFYQEALWVPKNDLTIRAAAGEGEVIIDGSQPRSAPSGPHPTQLPGLTAQDRTGLFVEGITFRGGSNSPPAGRQHGAPGVNIIRSRVELVRCRLEGGGTDPGAGMLSTDSHVVLRECILAGANGGDTTVTYPIPTPHGPYEGGAGVSFNGGSLRAFGCEFRGGAGGNGVYFVDVRVSGFDGARGGTGAVIAREAHAELYQCLVAGGKGGGGAAGTARAGKGGHGIWVWVSSHAAIADTCPTAGLPGTGSDPRSVEAMLVHWDSTLRALPGAALLDHFVAAASLPDPLLSDHNGDGVLDAGDFVATPLCEELEVLQQDRHGMSGAAFPPLSNLQKHYFHSHFEDSNDAAVDGSCSVDCVCIAKLCDHLSSARP